MMFATRPRGKAPAPARPAARLGRPDPPVVPPLPARKSDAELKRLVEEQLKWDGRVRETDIGVIVDGGVVTLTGTVPSYAQRHAAEQATFRVGGVRDVANEIRVAPAGVGPRTDGEIAHAVRHALEWDVQVPDERIRSSVRDCWVTLAGSVEHLHESEDAERAVRRLKGVRGLTNQIVTAGPAIAEARVRDAIVAALERRADREAKHIVVEVAHGTATLRGTVRSWDEKQAVLGAARATVGVQRVEDDLRIEATV